MSVNRRGGATGKGGQGILFVYFTFQSIPLKRETKTPTCVILKLRTGILPPVFTEMSVKSIFFYAFSK